MLLLASIAGIGAIAAPPSPFGDNLPSTANCTVHWFDQTIDHFNWGPTATNPPTYTYKQRYYVYDKFWKGAEKNAPIFFYFGNEDNVGLCKISKSCWLPSRRSAF